MQLDTIVEFMKFLYVYPETTGVERNLLDSGGVADVAQAVETAGWHGFGFTEHPVPGAKWLASGGHQTLDPFVALGAAASVTNTIRLLTYLTVAPYRNPNLLAKTAATVDLMSKGRFILGMGTGYLKSEFFSLGVDFEERNALFDEALDVLPLHWSGKPFSYSGRHFETRDAIALPAPVQQPIPIWIGGNAKLTIRRVAERAQGWMPLTSSPEVSNTARTPGLSGDEQLAEKIVELKTLAGDRAAGLDVAVAYTDDSVRALSTHVERHRDAMGRLEAAGATWIIVSIAPAPAQETLDFIAGFGETYISAVG
jgi:probable F420-dependent oxidoreductase